jgi:hypothetical protein
MKTIGSISVLLACVAGAWLLASQATAGTLIGTGAAVPGSVNLTIQDTLDWAHWGLATPADFDQKAGGTNQISNFSQIIGAVSNAVDRFDDAAVAYSRNDGTPTASAAGTTTGIYVAGLTNGYRFTVAAGTTVEELKVYAGAWNAKVHFEATVSDGSAAAYVDESFNDTGAAGAAVYTVKFAANSPGQTLTIKIYSAMLNDINGNCTLIAATLGLPPGAGTLNGSDTFLANGAVVDLTREGTLD